MLFITGAKSPDKSFPSVMKANTFRIESCVYDTKERERDTKKTISIKSVLSASYLSLLRTRNTDTRGRSSSYLLHCVNFSVSPCSRLVRASYIRSYVVDITIDTLQNALHQSLFFFLSLSLFFHRIYHLFTTHDASQRLL